MPRALPRAPRRGTPTPDCPGDPAAAALENHVFEAGGGRRPLTWRPVPQSLLACGHNAASAVHSGACEAARRVVRTALPPTHTHTLAARCVTLGESRNLSVPEAPAPVVWRTTPLGVHRTPPERPTSGLPPLPPFLRLPVRGDPGEADPFLSSPAVHTFPNAALQRPRDAAACASGRLL